MNLNNLLEVALIFVASLRLSHCELEAFELDEFLNGAFVNKGFDGVWVSGNQFHSRNKTTGHTMLFNAATGSSEILFEAEILTNYTGASYQLSPDLSYVLIRYNPKTVYRHSSIAQFAIYDLKEAIYYDVADEKHLQYAKWSTGNNALVYVFENNVYYVSSPANVDTPTQISSDGIPDVIYNGVPDWVYEEEVLASGSAIWFSPDGTKLAYGHFNDEDVEEFTYFIYGEAGSIEYQYPKEVKLRYPKVNTTNPTFELRVVSLNNPTDTKTLNILPEGAQSRDHVLFDITWATNDDIVAVVMNRIQNEATVKRCTFGANSCIDEFEYKENGGWLELQAPMYNSAGDKCLMILSQPEGDDSFQHLILYDTTTKGITRLTTGRRVVTSIKGWDESKGLVYYLGSLEDVPSQQHLYYVKVATVENTCITCNFITDEGFCLYGSASFSTDLSYMAEICSGPGPNTILINRPDNVETADDYETNSEIREKLATKKQPVIKDFDITVAGGFTAKARLLLPPDLDESASLRYPMVVNVYGGPDSNQISDSFSTGFKNYIVTNRRYIYAFIDGRGSGRKGNNIMFQIYKKMATVEIEDQISVTRTLRDTLPYIDPDRIGIWGWSYGGFATAWTLVKDTENIFKFGLSVAPVTDFTLYDTIYTERYMGLRTADDNEVGYAATDVTSSVEGFRNKQFFLIHGNADDNVHYQQSMLLAKALEHADILFYQLSYPDESHGLGSVHPHLYHTIDRFWARSFGLPDPQYRNLTKVQ